MPPAANRSYTREHRPGLARPRPRPTSRVPSQAGRGAQFPECGVLRTSEPVRLQELSLHEYAT